MLPSASRGMVAMRTMVQNAMTAVSSQSSISRMKASQPRRSRHEWDQIGREQDQRGGLQ
jgi:hypothetical protein